MLIISCLATAERMDGRPPPGECLADHVRRLIMFELDVLKTMSVENRTVIISSNGPSILWTELLIPDTANEGRRCSVVTTISDVSIRKIPRYTGLSLFHCHTRNFRNLRTSFTS